MVSRFLIFALLKIILKNRHFLLVIITITKNDFSLSTSSTEYLFDFASTVGDSISNFYKFWHQKNIKLRKKNETKFLKKIGLNKNFSREINYSYLRKDLNIDIKVKQFLNNFFDKLKIIKKKNSRGNFYKAC